MPTVCKWRLQALDLVVYPAYLTHPVKVNTHRYICWISIRWKEPLEEIFVMVVNPKGLF